MESTSRFLDLPTELRLLVYAYLPGFTLARTKVDLKLSRFVPALTPDRNEAQLELFTIWSPLTVLLTCRSIYIEAKKLLRTSPNRHIHGIAKKLCSDDKLYLRPRLVVHIADNELTSIDNGLRAAEHLIADVLRSGRPYTTSLETDIVSQLWMRQARRHAWNMYSQNEPLEIDVAIKVDPAVQFDSSCGRASSDIKKLRECQHSLERSIRRAWKEENGKIQVNVAILPKALDFDAYGTSDTAVDSILQFASGSGIKEFVMKKEIWNRFWTFDKVLVPL